MPETANRAFILRTGKIIDPQVDRLKDSMNIGISKAIRCISVYFGIAF